MNLTTTIHDGSRIVSTQGLTIAPVNFSVHAQRGFNRSEYSVAGEIDDLFDTLGFLGYVIKINDKNGNLKWAGYIIEATVTTKGFTVGFNLLQMYNRVRVRYSFTNLNGENEDGVTEWAENADSIARFGIKEKSLTMSDTKVEAANAKRDTFLAEHANPISIITFETSDVAFATMVAVGAWNLLDWNYYENLLGKEMYENNSSRTMAIGWQLTDTSFGFHYNKLHDHGCRLHHMPEGARFLVSGSGANNKWFTMTGEAENETVESVTSTSFVFDPLDDIALMENMGDFVAESMIRVEGSLSNDGYYFVKKPGDNAIEITGGSHTIVAEGSGRNTTISMGNRIQVSERIALERPGQTTTITIPSFKIGQPFRITAASGWSLKEIACQVFRVGTPVDQLRFSIYSDNDGVPGTSLCSALLVTADVPFVASWQSAVLTSSYPLALSTNYWLVIDRTGTADYQNYFMVTLGDDPALLSAPSLEIKLHDGSSWISEYLSEGDVKHYVGFQLWGVADTLTILKDMLDANRWFTNVYIPTPSGVEDYIYKSGEESVLAEADKIMQAGTATGKRLIIRAAHETDITIEIESSPQMASAIFYDINGSRKRGNGSQLDQTDLVAGEWVYIVGGNTPLARSAFPLSPVLIQESEFDANSGIVRIVPWSMDDDEEGF